MPKDKIHQVEDLRVERAVLVGLITKNQNEKQLKEYLDELEFLAETAGAQTEEKFWQKLDHPEKRTYVGSGKLAEIKTFVKAYDIDMVIFDDEITPSQQRNIENSHGLQSNTPNWAKVNHRNRWKAIPFRINQRISGQN